MAGKYTYEEVKKYYADKGCKLLIKKNEYKNVVMTMPYRCKCGEVSSTSFSGFRQLKKGCPTCAGTKKYTYEEVKKYYADQGCDLLVDEYKNASVSMPYKCKCGDVSSISFSGFKGFGSCCKKCARKKTTKAQSFSYEEVKQYFASQSCELLSKEYNNNHVPLEYICKCGNKSRTAYNEFKNAGHRCRECGIKKYSQNRSLGLEAAKIIFNNEGCRLLAEDYINNSTKMPYVCKCGNNSEINLTNFQSGTRCANCAPRSKGEVAIGKHLSKIEVIYESEVKYKQLGLLRFDFKIENILIEYQGKQHYSPYAFGSDERYAKEKNLIYNVQNDYKKLQWCRKTNTPILIIPYWDYNRIPEILNDVLAGRTPNFSEPPEIVLKHAPLRQKIRKRLGIEEPEILCGLFN